ncbi:hypothetical protein Rxycam_02537 [Rubrobacter xylanophilus DSM 9941]|uniref:Uncharacterized protein n=1 Tax=Rubrobacter xylanophilus TaxID=49319 RepID=A0A510HLW1_9ACTN|nr:hypothetical protein [Rubrobacter xylanophilus]QYJ16702.1 hypothetical protein Rxycam_02537 [Rubrobacter xylanophilus DSM 9941]BBL81011.1 hypothetical protein RxyAA322_28650 [Rubrobacter xylanophilus]
MAYSVMIWLTDPGPQAREEEALARSEAARETAPGAAAGVNEPPAFTRLVYGVYDDEAGAEEALATISDALQRNAPLRLRMRGNRSFLVPAGRVHYVVCDEVERPADRR